MKLEDDLYEEGIDWEYDEDKILSRCLKPHTSIGLNSSTSDNLDTTCSEEKGIRN